VVRLAFRRRGLSLDSGAGAEEEACIGIRIGAQLGFKANRPQDIWPLGGHKSPLGASRPNAGSDDCWQETPLDVLTIPWNIHGEKKMSMLPVTDSVYEIAAATAMIKNMTLPQLADKSIHLFVAQLEEEDRSLTEAIRLRKKANGQTPVGPSPSNGVTSTVSYRSTRLTFRREQIESLAPDGLIIIETPNGTFEITRSQFETDFPKVLSAASYSRAGVYHYPTIPAKAMKYLKERIS
jgi:hypothetical protein